MSVLGPKIKFVVFGFLEKSRRNIKILENPETFAKKICFGVPVLDCPYLWSGTWAKSENRITGVFLTKFFAARQEKSKNGQERAKNKIRRFWFF